MSWFKSPDTWDELKELSRSQKEKILELEHRIKQLQSDVDVATRSVEAKIEIAIGKAEVKHEVALLAQQKKLNESYHQKLSDTLTKGTPQTKFAQDMLLRVVDKAQVAPLRIGG